MNMKPVDAFVFGICSESLLELGTRRLALLVKPASLMPSIELHVFSTYLLIILPVSHTCMQCHAMHTCVLDGWHICNAWMHELMREYMHVHTRNKNSCALGNPCRHSLCCNHSWHVRRCETFIKYL